MRLHAELDASGDPVLVTAWGDLEFSNAAVLGDVLQDGLDVAQASHRHQVLLDAEGLTSVDSSGLAVVLAAHHSGQELGIELAAVSSPALDQVLDLRSSGPPRVSREPLLGAAPGA